MTHLSMLGAEMKKAEPWSLRQRSASLTAHSAVAIAMQATRLPLQLCGRRGDRHYHKLHHAS